MWILLRTTWLYWQNLISHPSVWCCFVVNVWCVESRFQFSTLFILLIFKYLLMFFFKKKIYFYIICCGCCSSTQYFNFEPSPNLRPTKKETRPIISNAKSYTYKIGKFIVDEFEKLTQPQVGFDVFLLLN